jgi:myo-inositol-1(or 4)-monophosphatase
VTVHPAHAQALEVAVTAARAGAAALISAADGDLEISYKDARANLVTVADHRSQQAITSVIRGTFPGHAIVGEEGTDGSAATDTPDVWYVDPLDGTTNFVHGLPFFCVSIALRSGGETVAGAVYDVSRAEMFAAARGGGATRDGEPICVSAVRRLDRALVVAQAQSVDPVEIRAYAGLVERLMKAAGGLRSLGSPALTLCAIAAGQLEAYCEHAMDAWDIAAGQLIVEEAGGVLTRFDGRPHRTADRADVVASNGDVHDELLAVLKGASIT